jgi:hypothetical protein
MINEIHAAITLQPLKTNGFNFWDDYVDPEWFVPNTLPQAFHSLREVFVTSPNIPEACAWRSYELRSLLEKTDFSDMRLVFDQRDGYLLSSIMRSMVDRFVMKKSGDVTNYVLSVNGPPSASSYEVFRYMVVANSSDISLTSDRYGTITESWNGNLALVRLHDSKATVTFKKFSGTGIIEWAATPTHTLVDVGKLLVARQQSELSDMVKEPSVFSRDQRELLAKVAADGSELGAQIVATGLLLAGCVKHHVAIASRTSS